jgi:MFS family permease
MSYHIRLFVLCFFGVAFGAMDSVLSSSFLPDIVRDLTGQTGDAATGHVGAWISFAFMAGGTLGGITMGYLSDRIGRKAVLMLALLCYGAGSGLGALAGSWEVLAATRLLVGAGVGAMLVVSAVIISEVWPGRTRAVALGILSVAYPVGIIASGALTAAVGDWRTAFVAGALPVLLSLPVRWMVQEPPEWSEAQKSREPVPVQGAVRSRLIAGILIYGAMLIGLWAAFAWLPTWVQSLLGHDAPEGQVQRGLSVMLLGLGGLVGGVCSGFLANHFGSKVVQAACFIACFGLCGFLFLFSTSYGAAVVAGIALLGIFFGISQGVLNSYIPELFPPAIRSTATALCFHTGRLFTSVAVFFVGALVVWFGGYGNAIFAFSTVYLVGLLALLLVKDTPDAAPGPNASGAGVSQS